jgi:hypothetical protein
MTTYPPQPWNLVADARVSVWRVPAADLPALAAQPLVIAGHASVFTAWIDYTPPGQLAYHELLAAVAVKGRRVSCSITEIWVDSEVSRDGGRDLWAIPKDLATLPHLHGDGGHRGRLDRHRGVHPPRGPATAPADDVRRRPGARRPPADPRRGEDQPAPGLGGLELQPPRPPGIPRFATPGDEPRTPRVQAPLRRLSVFFQSARFPTRNGQHTARNGQHTNRSGQHTRRSPCWPLRAPCWPLRAPCWPFRAPCWPFRAGPWPRRERAAGTPVSRPEQHLSVIA